MIDGQIPRSSRPGRESPTESGRILGRLGDSAHGPGPLRTAAPGGIR